MRLEKEIYKAQKISLVFMIIISFFDFLEKLCTVILIGYFNISAKDSIEHLFKTNILWLITVILIVLGLFTYIKRAEGKKRLNILHNPIVRLTSGLLVIFEGIIDFSNKVSVLFLNIQTYRHATGIMGEKELSDQVPFDDVMTRRYWVNLDKPYEQLNIR